MRSLRVLWRAVFVLPGDLLYKQCMWQKEWSMSRLKTGVLCHFLPLVMLHCFGIWMFFPLGKQVWRLSLKDTVPFLLYESIVFPTFWVSDCSKSLRMFFGVVQMKLSTEAWFRWTHTRLHHGNKQPLHCFKSPLNVLGCRLTAWTQTSITIAISSSPCLYPLEDSLPTFLNYFGWL